MLKNRTYQKIVTFFFGLFFTLLFAEVFLSVVGVYENSQRKGADLDKAASNKIKILTIGNSYTVGVGAEEGDSYSDFLNKILNEKSKNSFEVVNKGIVNANSSFILEKLDGWIDRDPPSYALLMIGEPNYWNTYNYTNFLTKKKEVTLLEKVLQKTQGLRLYRLYQLIEYQFQTKEDESQLFKNIPRNEKNKKRLGYSYLAALDYSIVLDIKSLDDKTKVEAIESLEKVFKENQGQGVSRVLAALYFNKNEFDKGLSILESAVKNLTLFDFNIYSLLNETNFPKEIQQRVLDLKASLSKKEFLIDLQQIVKMDKEKEFFIEKDDAEKAKNLYSFYQHAPNRGNLAIFLSRYFINNRDSRLYDLMKLTLENNPLTMAYDVHAQINTIKEKFPQKVEEMNKFLGVIEERIGQKVFNISSQIDKTTKGKWVIHDLEQMIKKLRAKNIIVIVQTYPPMRSEMIRPVDNVLRQWWKSREKQENVYFQDLNIILRKKFDDRTPDGARYYSKNWGSKDPHQSRLGNIALAEEMSSFLLRIQARDK